MKTEKPETSTEVKEVIENLSEKKDTIEQAIEETKEEIKIAEPEVKEEIREEVKELVEEKKEVEQELKIIKEETKTPEKSEKKKNSDIDTFIWIAVIVILLVVGYYIYKYFKNVETEITPENVG